MVFRRVCRLEKVKAFHYLEVLDEQYGGTAAVIACMTVLP